MPAPSRQNRIGTSAQAQRAGRSRVAHPLRRASGRGARRRARQRRAPSTANGHRRPIAPIPSSCSWRSRPRRVHGAGPDPLRADARVAVHVLPRRRLPDGRGSGRRRRAPGCTRSSAATRICRTSAASRRPTGGSSSASTTSTRRCPARSSGTSSGSSRASRSPAAIAASTPRSARAINRAAVRVVPRGDARVRRDAEPRPLVLPPRRRRAARALRRSAATSKEQKRFERNVAKARVEGQHAGVRQADDDGRRRAADHQRPAADHADRGLSRPAIELRRVDAFVHDVIRSYRRTLAGDRRQLLERFRYVHAARKVVGVGSVGTRAWICSCSAATTSDPLFLQFKEAQASVLEPFLGTSEFAKHGQRVVEGQRLTQAASDIMLGWITIERPRRRRSATSTSASSGTAKGSALVELMEPQAMAVYAEICGRTLATAHARSGDAIAIASYLGSGDTLRPRARDVRRDLRRPERARLRRAEERGCGVAGGGRDGVLSVTNRPGTTKAARGAACPILIGRWVEELERTTSSWRVAAHHPRARKPVTMARCCSGR